MGGGRWLLMASALLDLVNVVVAIVVDVVLPL